MYSIEMTSGKVQVRMPRHLWPTVLAFVPRDGAQVSPSRTS